MYSAKDYAELHRKFLEDANPEMLRQLRQSGNLNSYLSSVGNQAKEMQSDLVHQYKNSPEARKLPHLELVRALQNRLMEADEVVRHDLINQPMPETNDQ